MQHLALKVKNNNELIAMHDRLRSKGVPVPGPIEHGMCRSIYFAGLENMTLEFSHSPEPIDNRPWIDPEVVELMGLPMMSSHAIAILGLTMLKAVVSRNQEQMRLVHT
jgi:hypothetical protein